MRVTVYYGYALFLFALIGAALTVFPWFSVYNSEYINPFNVTMLLVSFVFTALAAPLIGYLVGDSATRSKLKLVHHYNGVLFGVLGVWLWLTLSLIVSYGWQLIGGPVDMFFDALINLSPAIIAALITILLGVSYARKSQTKLPLIDYKPYGTLLITSAALLVPAIALSVGASASNASYIALDFLVATIAPILFMLVATLVGYWILGKSGGTTRERIVRSLVAAGFAIVTLNVTTQLAGVLSPWTMELYNYLLVVMVAVWLSYLILVRRALKK